MVLGRSKCPGGTEGRGGGLCALLEPSSALLDPSAVDLTTRTPVAAGEEPVSPQPFMSKSCWPVRAALGRAGAPRGTQPQLTGGRGL